MNKEIIAPVVAFVVGLGVGGAVGYFVAAKRLEAKYDALAKEEITSVKEKFRILRKEDEYADPSEIVKAKGYEEAPKRINGYESLIDELGYSREDEDEDEDEQPTLNIFADVAPDAPFEPERSDDEPYLISVDEFMDEEEFEQHTITYFEVDDTLIDEEEKIIPDVEGVIGSKNLSKFGQQSSSLNHVYVKNHKMMAVFEVVKDESSYAQAILGIDDDEDEKRPRVLKMRPDMRDDD